MDAQTASHVRLLAIFHYVLAGLAVVGSFLPGLYVAMGWALLSGTSFVGKNSNATPPPPQIGWIFIALGVALMAAALGFAVLVLMAGRFLSRTRHWTYCIVTAALSCALFPFGTILGVFTIVILVKPEVKAAFEGGRPAAPPPPPYATGA
jgi:hypothetical protein